jgi:hypothetical protein
MDVTVGSGGDDGRIVVYGQREREANVSAVVECDCLLGALAGPPMQHAVCDPVQVSADGQEVCLRRVGR